MDMPSHSLTRSRKSPRAFPTQRADIRSSLDDATKLGRPHPRGAVAGGHHRAQRMPRAHAARSRRERRSAITRGAGSVTRTKEAPLLVVRLVDGRTLRVSLPSARRMEWRRTLLGRSPRFCRHRRGASTRAYSTDIGRRAGCAFRGSPPFRRPRRTGARTKPGERKSERGSKFSATGPSAQLGCDVRSPRPSEEQAPSVVRRFFIIPIAAEIRRRSSR